MVRSFLIDSNKHEKWCFAAEISAKLYRFQIHSEIDNTSPLFAWYLKMPSIHELRTFGCKIYPITPSPKNIYMSKHKKNY